MSIQPLPPDVIAQIKSSISITSLNGVICELVKNSLDAGATKLDVNVDYSRGGCCVEDDGFGILPFEFRKDGHLGKPYHSSKGNSHSPVHGGRGTFLAALSALAVVSITSHHHSHRSHNTLTMHRSEVVSRQIPAPLQQCLTNATHGTRVAVRDLFGNMPVRVKQRAIVAGKQRGNAKDWEELKRAAVSILLAWHSVVALTLRDSETSQKLTLRPSHIPLESGSRSVAWACNILAQGSFISYEEKSSWLSIGASTPKLAVSGAISLTPVATKHVQFLSLGIQPIIVSGGQSVLHDEINRLFANSAFGVAEETEGLDTAEQERRTRDSRYKGYAYTSKELKGPKKGVDRWPMFYINIRLPDSGNSKTELDEILDDKGESLSMIMELLQAIVLEFLSKHHFRPEAGHDRWSKRAVENPAALSNLEQSKVTLSPKSNTQSTTLGRSIDHAKAGKGKSLKKKYQPDSLGTNVRLPSFRQNVLTSDSPFDNWSRVKQGTALSRSLTPKNPLHVSEGSKIIRPSTAPPSSKYLTRPGTRKSSTPNPLQRTFKPLLSKDGKILRAPFEDIAEAKSGSSSTTQAPIPTSITHEIAPEANDDVIVWTTPVTKTESLINQRTGLTMKSNGSFPPERDRSTRLSSRFNETIPGTASSESPSPWIRGLLKSWDNPIFMPTEPSIPQVAFQGPGATTQNILHGRHHHCSQMDIDRAFKESSSNISGQISKDALKHAEVVSQVDMKFILVKLRSSRSVLSDDGHYNGGDILALIDQHAADERIRVESLMEELCSPPTPELLTTTKSRILTNLLDLPLNFEISSKETQLLQTHQTHFANWGILYNLSAPTVTSTLQRLTVHSLPPSILERCKSDPRLLISLIRTEVWKVHESGKQLAPVLESSDWLQRISSCPQGILDILNSRSCRSAIMFNDELSKEQCELLLRRLAECMFPFQCAHGRPSLVPLVNVGSLGIGGIGSGWRAVAGGEMDVGGFGRNFRQWSRNMLE